MKIIAEVGSNWASIEDCKKSIQLAKACGADAVKFQLFTDEALYGFPARAFGGLPPMPVPGQLPLDWLPILKEKADAHEIEFMCSAFSPELIDAVNPFVKTHKVASAELTHVRMLEKLRAIGKPVILSTGASGDADIAAALAALEWTSVTLMYCVSEYPARTVDLFQIPRMRELFGKPVGFSDHTTDVYHIPQFAMLSDAIKASIIEKHVNFVGATGPDADYALTADEFANMCKVVKGLEQAPRPAPETAMRLRHNRRLIAIKDIAPYEIFEEGVNFGIYRSLKDDTEAFSPWVISRVDGKPALKALRAGDGIGPGAVTL